MNKESEGESSGKREGNKGEGRNRGGGEGEKGASGKER